MVDTEKTEIVVLVDRSGSMASVRADMEGGFNTFISKQKELPGKCSVTLAQFDDKYELVYQNKPLAEVPNLDLVPRGWTALLDAVGRTISEVGDRLRKTPEHKRPGKLLFMIITDGQENRSVEFKREKVKEMVKHQTDKYQWDFIFLGANQDAFLEAEKLGIFGTSSISFDHTKQGYQDLWGTVSNTAETVRGLMSNDRRGINEVIGSMQASYNSTKKTTDSK
jgi:hypothetical protein